MSSTPKGAPAAGEKPKRKQNPLMRLYLVLFNLLSTAAWSATLACVVQHLFVRNGTVATLYAAPAQLPGGVVVSVPALPQLPSWAAPFVRVTCIGELLAVTQSLAFMEIVHSAIGAVPSPVATVAMQVASRLLLVWGITVPVPGARLHWGYAMMVLSWCVVEIPRYAYYVVNLIAPSAMPYPLTWLRYSLFAVLYPTGISGELSCIWQALPHISATQMWTIAMPNAWNFAFSWYWACVVILALYAPGSPVMYKHMLHQRNKNLGGATAPAKDKAKTH